MSSKYVDISAVVQVIGTIYKNPQLLELSDKYNIIEEDFNTDFHRVVYGCIYNLYELGAEKITLKNISDYLADRPKYQAIYQREKGEEWLIKASENALPQAFDYYYSRLKKMTLLRMYDAHGIDVSDIYDPDNILDIIKKQKQEEELDNSSLEDIANKVDLKIDTIKSQYVSNFEANSYQAGEGVFELIDKLKKFPEIGVPLYGPLINSVTKGARLKKFYLRSAPTGVGKSRSMVADACQISCTKIYDDNLGWVKNLINEPCLYITTEQEFEEVQTMMLAFLSNVPEDHILDGRYKGDEENRVYEAGRILEASPLYIELLPDFSLQDIEDTIKRNIREHDVKYVFNPKRVLGQ